MHFWMSEQIPDKMKYLSYSFFLRPPFLTTGFTRRRGSNHSCTLPSPLPSERGCSFEKLSPSQVVFEGGSLHLPTLQNFPVFGPGPLDLPGEALLIPLSSPKGPPCFKRDSKPECPSRYWKRGQSPRGQSVLKAALFAFPPLPVCHCLVHAEFGVGWGPVCWSWGLLIQCFRVS